MTAQSPMRPGQIKVLVDGACPLCRREARIWRKLDRGREAIVLEDISAPGFDPTVYGLTREQVMAEIHGVLSSGETIRGMDVFRAAYAAVGWGWLVAPTGWPLLKPLFDVGYRWFARNRLRITGRPDDCGAACGPRRHPVESTS